MSPDKSAPEIESVFDDDGNIVPVGVSDINTYISDLRHEIRIAIKSAKSAIHDIPLADGSNTASLPHYMAFLDWLTAIDAQAEAFCVEDEDET